MKLKYRPEIDGLRAIAVVPVILFHAGFEIFSGGYTGVDVFFVISGYLITSIIYSELQSGKFSIINFYERRARRILPLLFCILLVSTVFAWVSLFQIDMIDYFESLIAVTTFSSNFLFVTESNYFDTSVDLKPLLHTWSLAVEEQYYIFFPLFMMLFFYLFLKKRIVLVLIITGIASFILAEWASVAYPTHNFYLVPSRTWELAVGAILAIIISDGNSWFIRLRNQNWISETAGLSGLILILLGIFIIKEDTPFPSSYALFPVIGTAMIIGFARKNSFVGAILSSKPLVIIGLISYSAYMWHHPMIAFTKHLSFAEQSFFGKAALCLAVFPISYLSWKFIENPFRDKQRFKRKFIFTFSFLGSLFFILLGVVGLLNDGFPNRNVNTRLEVRNYEPDNRILKLTSWESLDQTESKVGNNSWFKSENVLPNMLLIGNSHSKDLYNVLMSSTDANENFEIGRIGAQIFELSNSNHELFNSPSYNEADWIVLVSRYRTDDLPVMESVVERFIKDRKKVVIVKPIQEFPIINARTAADLVIQEYIRNGLNLDDEAVIDDIEKEIDKAYYQDVISGPTSLKLDSDEVIDAIKIDHPNVIVMDRMKYVCDDTSNRCFAINSNLEKYFYDYGHHTVEGALFFGQRVDEVKWLDTLLNTD